MKYLSENFWENIYCHFEFEHDIEKNGGCSTSNSHWKHYSKIKKKNLPPFYKRNGFLNCFQNLFSTLYNIYFSHQIGWAVFKKIRFFDFSKFVHNFCKKFFFEFILKVNLSCNGSHLPSKYGSNPSGGTQAMLILLRLLFIKFVHNN